MDAVKIIKDARWRLEVGDITREQYKELVAPLRDVEVVRYGRWKWNGEAFICSACGNGHKGQPTIMGQPMFEFCPICGARMDGEDGGND